MSFACAQCCYVLLQQMTRNDSENFLPLSSKLRAWAEWASLQETTPALQRHRPWPELLPKKLKEKSRIHWTTHCIHHCRIASFEQNCFMLSWLQKDLPNQRSDQLLKVQPKGLFLKEVDIIGKEKQSGPCHPRHQQQSMSLSGRQNCPRFSLSGAICKVPYELHTLACCCLVNRFSCLSCLRILRLVISKWI